MYCVEFVQQQKSLKSWRQRQIGDGTEKSDDSTRVHQVAPQSTATRVSKGRWTWTCDRSVDHVVDLRGTVRLL